MADAKDAIFTDAPPSYDTVQKREDGDTKSVFKDLSSPVEATPEAVDLELLRKYDTVILVDDSGSMALPCTDGSPKGLKNSRWAAAIGAIEALADTLKDYDGDGFDVHFLNARPTGGQNLNLKSKEAVTALFRVVGRPSQCTPMRSNLAAILEPYVKNYEQFANNPSPDTMLKPCNLIIVTDGDCREDRVPDLIKDFKHRLQEADAVLNSNNTGHGEQLNMTQTACKPLTPIGLQFLQIGDDEACKEWLETLDNDTQEDSYDIVDHRLYNPETGFTGRQLIEAVIGGISRDHDRDMAWYS